MKTKKFTIESEGEASPEVQKEYFKRIKYEKIKVKGDKIYLDTNFIMYSLENKTYLDEVFKLIYGTFIIVSPVLKNYLNYI